MPNADERTWISPIQKVLELQARVERLEEALRTIYVDSQIPHAAPAHLGWLARRALAHEEEK